MKTPNQKWPDAIWIVRHGESAGNVARQKAHEAGLPRIDIDIRDIDVPLSPLGERQARALGHWFGRIEEDERPTAVLTAEIVCEEAGLDREDVGFCCDERLREKEFGILDRFTRIGIREHHPEQAELRLL